MQWDDNLILLKLKQICSKLLIKNSNKEILSQSATFIESIK